MNVLTVCWAAKGGSGTTVVTCALALLSARHDDAAALLIDLAGDSPAALGIAEPAGPGVHDWVAASSAPASSIGAIGVDVIEDLRLIPAGLVVARADHPRWTELAHFVEELDVNVVVDAGTGTPPAGLLQAADHRILVTRACYLSLRRAASSGLGPTGVIVLHEPGRALSADDVAAATRAPVVGEVSMDPAVARAVDAGLLAARMPRSLAAALRGFAA